MFEKEYENNEHYISCTFPIINSKTDFNSDDKFDYIEGIIESDFEMKKYFEKSTFAKSKDIFENNTLIKNKIHFLKNENNFKENSSPKTPNNLINNGNLEIIIENNKENKKKTIRKKPGRKTKRSRNEVHNKFASDNIMRKCKHFVLKSLLKFINEKIKFLYNDNIGRGVVIKELKTLDQYQIANATIKFNQDFLKKTIEEIFSENISGRYSVLLIDHNKKLIKNLLNENDENKKIYFTKLFSLSFKECLNHFIEKEYVDELQGLTCFSQIKDKILKDYPEDGENYYDNLKYYLENFEERLYSKKARKK